MSVAAFLAGVGSTRNRHDEPKPPEHPPAPDKPKVRHPRNSALHGHVDYVDFAERVGLGVTVEEPSSKRASHRRRRH